MVRLATALKPARSAAALDLAARFLDGKPTQSPELSDLAIAARRVQLNSEGPLQPPPAAAPQKQELLAEQGMGGDVRKDSSLPDFPNLTAMLVMPFRQFVAQGRIMKSVKSWRDEALAKGWLVEFKEGSGKVAIFISHTCALPR